MGRVTHGLPRLHDPAPAHMEGLIAAADRARRGDDTRLTAEEADVLLEATGFAFHLVNGNPLLESGREKLQTIVEGGR